MNNEIELIAKGIAGSTKENASKELFKLFSILNPFAYRGLSKAEIDKEIAGIMILIGEIDCETLGEMVRRGVQEYSNKRLANDRLIFNINYIMEFYKEAFDYVHCERFELPLGAKRLTNHYDEKTGIIEQRWQSKTGEIVDIKCFAMLMPESKRPYSKMDEAQIWTDLDSLVL